MIVDNGRSDNRLTYEESIPSVVIAVGGATLSRGLTLEGLSVAISFEQLGSTTPSCRWGDGSVFGKATKTYLGCGQRERWPSDLDSWRWSRLNFEAELAR